MRVLHRRLFVRGIHCWILLASMPCRRHVRHAALLSINGYSKFSSIKIVIILLVTKSLWYMWAGLLAIHWDCLPVIRNFEYLQSRRRYSHSNEYGRRYAVPLRRICMDLWSQYYTTHGSNAWCTSYMYCIVHGMCLYVWSIDIQIHTPYRVPIRASRHR